MKSQIAFLSAFLFISWPLLSASAKDSAKPNIVVMLVDDMGIMDTSVPFLTDADGTPKKYPLNEFYRTPNMERLAARGIRFNQFCAMSVCSPTRISIMTGQNAARHRTTNWINPDNNNAGPSGPSAWNWEGLKKDSLTLPRLMKDSGYRTIHVGKGHFGPREFEGADPSNIGFDVNVGGASIGAPGSYYGQEDFRGKGRREHHAVPGLEKYHGQEIFLTEALTREAKLHVADAVAEDKPFFLYFAQYAVHGPFQADQRFAANYADSGKPESAQAFATLIEGMDKSLGDILDHLDELKVADNTLVFFLGDNGSDAPLGHQHEVACAAPLRGKKGSHYEGGMRVPFIAAWAKPTENTASQNRLPIPAGVIQDQQASVYDLFPTILGLINASAPKSHAVDGAPLNTLLSGKKDKSRSTAFLMHYPHSPHRTEYFTSYRDGDWKVIYHYFPSQVSGDSHYQLFNLATDPFEQNDLSQSQPQQLKRMIGAMVEGLEAQEAVYPRDPKSGETVKPKLPS
jgi:arylsulfatase A-like enzyme